MDKPFRYHCMQTLARKFAKVIVAKIDDEFIGDAYNAIIFLRDLIVHSKNLRIILESPIVQKNKKLELFELILKNSNVKFPKIVQNLVRFLIINDNMRLLTMIAAEYHKLILKKNNITQVNAFFAKKPSKAQVKEVEIILKDKYLINPEIEVDIDESLFAGFILKFNGKMVDASMKNYFANIANIHLDK